MAHLFNKQLWLWLPLGLALLVWAGLPTASRAQPAASASASASAAPSVSASAPPPAPKPEPIPEPVLRLREKTERVRALLAGELDTAIDAPPLFDVDITDAEAVAVEARRLAAVVERAQEDALSDVADAGADAAAEPADAGVFGDAGLGDAGDAGVGEVDYDALRVTSPLLWEARVALDESRLAFFRLPPSERAALLDAHLERQKVDRATQTEKELSEADRHAEKADRDRLVALEAAKQARSEAMRAVHNEHARLLDVTKRQAEYSKELISSQRAVEESHDEALGERRRVREAIERYDRERDAVMMDELYDELRVRLRQSRDALAAAIDSIAVSESAVPTAGDDPLITLPAEVDRSKVDAARSDVVREAAQLLEKEQAFRSERARILMAEVEMLNAARLALLPRLSPHKRDDITGFGPAGLNQGRSEIRQVWLTLRYHLSATAQWVDAMRTGEGRGESAWAATLLALKWLVPVVVFVWWRRRAERLLKAWRAAVREDDRKRRGSATQPSLLQRSITFIMRVRSPLEWLLLWWSVHWLLPEPMKAQLEVQLLNTILSWTLGGALVVSVIDGLSSHRVSGRRALSATQTAHLRLKSLRLVGRAVVTFGLILALSDRLVGQGTIYEWVFSTCWFAAIPILLWIVKWWKPVIFERVELIRKKGRFEEWVLANGEGPKGFAASIAAGVYLFATGTWRVLRSWVVTFTVTRRVLAYLFRRDMTKKASGAAVEFKRMNVRTFKQLGPETPSESFVPSVADEQVKDVVERIQKPGGGVFAIVGERGAGKTTLTRRIADTSAKLHILTCPSGGLMAFKQALNTCVGLDPDAPFEETAVAVEGDEGTDSAVLIDDAHHLILPMMGGLRDFDQVLDLARSTSHNCSWIFAIDGAIWRFLERARGAKPLFDDVIYLRPWTEEGIVRLLTQRNQVVGIAPRFEHLLTDLPVDADDIDRLEALDRTETNYYRLLWDYATGNPGVALHFWRRSLGLDADGNVCVRLFRAPDADDLAGLPDGTVFVLRAIVQLGWATLDQICHATNLPADEVKDALRYGTVQGYFDHESERYQITWNWFRAITRHLKRRHLIASG